MAPKRSKGLRSVELDTETIKEQARPHLLGSLPIHIDMLSAEWDFGSNRAINPRHVQDLIKQFEAHGIHRISPEYRLLVSCSLQDWQIVCNHYLIDRNDHRDPTATNVSDESKRFNPFYFQPSSDHESVYPLDEIPRITDWVVLTGHHLQLLAGQHRVAALRKYLYNTINDSGDISPQEKTSVDCQLWWMCDVYNQG